MILDCSPKGFQEPRRVHFHWNLWNCWQQIFLHFTEFPKKYLKVNFEIFEICGFCLWVFWWLIQLQDYNWWMWVWNKAMWRSENIVDGQRTIFVPLSWHCSLSCCISPPGAGSCWRWGRPRGWPDCWESSGRTTATAASSGTHWRQLSKYFKKCKYFSPLPDMQWSQTSEELTEHEGWGAEDVESNDDESELDWLDLGSGDDVWRGAEIVDA